MEPKDVVNVLNNMVNAVRPGGVVLDLQVIRPNPRVEVDDDRLVCEIDGEPLFVKLVEQGRIVYRESFDEQADRADRTWGRYKRVELSAKIHDYQEHFRAMREREVAAARKRMTANT